MASNDDSRSVRVEVDGASAPILEVPELGGPASRPSRWPIALVVLLVVAVGAALVWLSPDEGVSADGTDRAVPTTVPNEAAPTDDPLVSEEPQVEAAVGLEDVIVPTAEAPFELSEPITPIQADAPRDIDQIIETADGFLGLGRVQFSSPQLLRSVDGLVWEQVETSITGLASTELGPLTWNELFVTEGGFGVIGSFNEDEEFRTGLAFSPDAVDWTLADGATPFFIRPFAAQGDSVIGLGFTEQPIEDVLRNFTEVQVPGVGVCGVFRTPSQERQFELFGCASRESVLLDASTIRDGVAVDLLLDCVADLSAGQIGLSATFAQTELDGSALVSLGRESSRWTPTDVPLVLGAGSSDGADARQIAFIDVGVREAEDCARFVAVEPARDPSVVVLGADGSEQIVPLPFDLDNGNGAGSIFGLRIIGSTIEFAEGQHLLIEFREQVWSLNIASASWSLLFDQSVDGPVEFGPIVPSIDGDRLFQITSEGVRIFELSELAGALTADIGLALVDGPDSFMNSALARGFTYASSDRLFVTDTANQLWSIDLPEAPIERPPEFIPDFGGVGSARVR